MSDTDPTWAFEAASWWTRGKAALIDGLIFMAVMLVPAILVIVGYVTAKASIIRFTIRVILPPWSWDEITEGPAISSGTMTLVVLGAVLSIGVLVWAGWLFGYRQGVIGTTPGKRRLGIHLVDAASREAPGGLKGVGRFLVPGLVGLLPGIGNGAQIIDYLWPLWDSKKQRLADKVFKTRVVVSTHHLSETRRPETGSDPNEGRPDAGADQPTSESLEVKARQPKSSSQSQKPPAPRPSQRPTIQMKARKVN